MSSLTFFNQGAPPIFFIGSHTPALTEQGRRKDMEGGAAEKLNARLNVYNVRYSVSNDPLM